MTKSSALFSVLVLVLALGAVVFCVSGDDSALPAPLSEEFFDLTVAKEIFRLV